MQRYPCRSSTLWSRRRTCSSSSTSKTYVSCLGFRSISCVSPGRDLALGPRPVRPGVFPLLLHQQRSPGAAYHAKTGGSQQRLPGGDRAPHVGVDGAVISEGPGALESEGEGLVALQAVIEPGAGVWMDVST